MEERCYIDADSTFFPSDLVNGLVLLMNNNISSPVNLVSLSHFVLLNKLIENELCTERQIKSEELYMFLVYTDVTKVIVGVAGEPRRTHHTGVCPPHQKSCW